MSSASIQLNTGKRMPMIGLGTSKSKGAIIQDAVEFSIEVGYRHFDCAHVYGNEADIGDAILAKIEQGVVKREDLFITSKLGCSCQHPENVERALEQTLADLKLDYLDLYSIHWPFGLQYAGPHNHFPSDEDGNLLFDEDVDYVDTWLAMEQLYKTGKARAIGISNFNTFQIGRILKHGRVVPAVHQVECHPYLNQSNLIEFCQSKGIAVIAYSPFSSPDRPGSETRPSIFKDEVLLNLAKKYCKTVAQIVLKYQIQRQVCIVPRSTNSSRIKENICIFDFYLSPADCEEILKLNEDLRTMFPTRFVKHKYFPFVV